MKSIVAYNVVSRLFIYYVLREAQKKRKLLRSIRKDNCKATTRRD